MEDARTRLVAELTALAAATENADHGHAAERLRAFVERQPDDDGRLRILGDLRAAIPVASGADPVQASDDWWSATASNLVTKAVDQRNTASVLDSALAATADQVSNETLAASGGGNGRDPELVALAGFATGHDVDGAPVSAACRLAATSLLLKQLEEIRKELVAGLRSADVSDRVLSELMGVDRTSLWRSADRQKGDQP